MTIDGESAEYVRADSVPEAAPPHGPLTMLVLHRGFIFVGEWDGVTLTRAKNVRRWTEGGIGGLTLGAKSSKAVLDPHADVKPSLGAILHTSPLPKGWADA